ncbi:type II secretion system protein [Opitutaceae bacterium TAV4]|nr:type II secretion system protein [Opitutaceae bacterium TAV4]RRJ98883.1 type II secretion system protein [Opitutaceae bacterium TAV3]
MREKPENMRKVTFIHSPNFDIIISMKSAFPALLPPDRQKRQTGAFTLVELLVVIVIIGILTAITIPVVGRVRESARATECQSYLHQYGSAMWLYAADHQNKMVKSYRRNDDDTASIGWAHDLRPYLDVIKSRKFNQNPNKIRISYSCPTFEANERDLPKYNENAALGYHMNSNFSDKKMVSLDPARSVVVYDAFMSSSWAASAPDPSKSGGSLAHRHRDRIHLLFVDAHVQSMAKGQYGDARDYTNLVWKP